MTLIAGFRSFGTPVLIGDFLITDGDAVSGLRKKVVLISDNFVLAWTGHLLAADSVVRALQSSLDLAYVTLKSVESILTNPATTDLGSLHVSIVCWITDDQGQHCFRWNSSYPKELFLGEPMYDGSGDSFVEALAGTGLRHSSVPDSIDPNEAVEGALFVTTQLILPEMIGPSTLSHGFGFAYEILLAKEHRFEYVDDILYFTVTYDMDRAGKFIKPHFVGSIYKYQSRDNYSLIHILEPNKNTHNVHIVTPVGQQSNETPNTLSRMFEHSDHNFPFRSQYYCVFIQFNAPDFKSPPFVIVQGERVPQNNRMFDITAKNELLLHTNSDMIEFMYQTICEDQASKATGSTKGDGIKN